MAANTITVQQAIFQIAQNVGDLLTGVVTTYSSDTSIACAFLAESSDDAYNYGLMRKMGGTAYATISDYTGSTRTFTLAGTGITALSAEGDIVQWCGFNMMKRGALFEAVNNAIRESWGNGFYRETEVNRSSATITLASGTTTYSLPAACSKLIRVGIQPTTSDGITWFDPLKIYRVYGEEGAYTIEFLPQYSGIYSSAWSSAVRIPSVGQYSTFADAFSTEKLCLFYLEREPEVDAEDDTIRLPLNYVGWVGADFYSQWLLANGTDDDRRVLNVHLPQIQQNALKARAQLALTKPKVPQVVTLDF